MTHGQKNIKLKRPLSFAAQSGSFWRSCLTTFLIDVFDILQSLILIPKSKFSETGDNLT